MPVEYDLVVIGDSFEGIYAAAAAVALDARVALVVSPTQKPTGSIEAIYSRTLGQMGAWLQYQENSAQWGLSLDSKEPSQGRWTAAIAWANKVIDTLALENSLESLAALGVDAILGDGEFCQQPDPALRVNHRTLRSRAYLLAMSCDRAIPHLEGLSQLGYLTPTDLWQEENPETLPQTLLVWGGTPLGVELAQSLRRLGKDVTLIAASDRILPAEDPQASRWIQAKLEAEGVRLFTQSPVTQVKQLDDKKWVQAGDRAIEADEIILAAREIPKVKSLNLEAVGVQIDSDRITTNAMLQTTNPSIYACGGAIGGYPLAHIAQYEARIALKNALFWPRFKVDYRSIPWAIFTEPNLARVGMTEAQARRRYGQDVSVVQQYFKRVPQALIVGETTGFCKFVLHERGEILGAHIVGHRAAEFIGTIALAVQHRIEIDALVRLPQVSPTLSEILHQTAIEWQRDRLQRNKTAKKLRQFWFRWQRNWHK